MGADSPADPAADLRKAWDDWIEELQLARDALEDPAYHPAPASDRNLGEGYRYLLGHLHRLIEAEAHQDPDFPYFQPSTRRAPIASGGALSTTRTGGGPAPVPSVWPPTT
jgi:hypothetical protein